MADMSSESLGGHSGGHMQMIDSFGGFYCIVSNYIYTVYPTLGAQ